MASIGAAIYAALINNTEVVNTVAIENGLPDIVPNYAPQREQYPQVVYEAKDAEYDKTYSGNSGLAKQEVTVRCVAKNYTDADTLANAVINALDNQSGTFDGITVQRFFLNDDAEDQFTNPDDETLTLYVRELSIECWFNL